MLDAVTRWRCILSHWLDEIPGSDSYFELSRMLKDPMKFLSDRYDRHGEIFKTRFLVPVVMLIGPAANKLVHITERVRFSYKEAYRDLALGRLLRGSLIVQDGEEHQHARDILQPGVGRLGLSGSLEAVQDIWSRAVPRLEATGTADAYELVRDVTFEVSANALLDLELEAELGEFRPLFETLAAGTMANLPYRFPFGKIDRGMKARAELIKRLTPRIEQARSRPPKGMVGLLAHHTNPDGTSIPAERIAEHLLLLFWAGYDTTATTGSWLLYELARAPAWQQLLVDEQRAVLGDSQRPTLEQLDKLVKHGWVLKEIERLRPSVIFFPRRTVQPFEFSGKHVPAGQLVFYSPYATHRIPSLFPNPDAFDPSRWDPARGKEAASPTALVGFGGGPRICLGKAFALMQLRVLLTTVLRRFEVTIAPGSAARTIQLPMNRLDDAKLRFTRRSAASGAPLASTGT